MALNNKTVSSKTIIRKIFRDLRPKNDHWIDDAIEWVGEALEHIGAASQLVQKQCILTVANHKVLLPTDLYYINQVAINNNVSPTTTQELDTLITKCNIISEIKENPKIYIFFIIIISYFFLYNII